MRIEWRDIGGGSTQIVRYLETQYQTDPTSVGIDLLFGGGTDIYLDFKAKGRLEAYSMPPDLRRKIPQQVAGVDIYDRDGCWHGVMLSSLGILYNRDMIRRLGLGEWQPQSWRDLGDPRLLGWVTAGDSRMSGSVRMLYELILQSYGWDAGFRTLMQLGANAHGFARFSDSVTKDVVFGRAVAGGSLDSYAFSAIARDQESALRAGESGTHLGFAFPRGETLLNPDSIGILKGAPNRELAEKFVEFNLSEDGGQRLWMLRPNSLPGSPQRYSICRLSVMPGMFDPKAYPPEVRSVQVDPFDEQGIGKVVDYRNELADGRRHAVNDLIGCWIIDTHPELHAAWQAVLASKSNRSREDPLEQALFAPPCKEGEVKAINAAIRSGPRARSEWLDRWLDEARTRYRRVRAEAEGRTGS